MACAALFRPRSKRPAGAMLSTLLSSCELELCWVLTSELLLVLMLGVRLRLLEIAFDPMIFLSLDGGRYMPTCGCTMVYAPT